MQDLVHEWIDLFPIQKLGQEGHIVQMIETDYISSEILHLISVNLVSYVFNNIKSRICVMEYDHVILLDPYIFNEHVMRILDPQYFDLYTASFTGRVRLNQYWSGALIVITST